MTMINPDQNISKQHCYGGNYYYCYYNYSEGSYYGVMRSHRLEGYGCSEELAAPPPTYTNCLLLGSDLVVVGGQMAEDQDESRTTGDHYETTSVVNEAEAAASAMSSKDAAAANQEEDDPGWLQLSIGTGLTATAAAHNKQQQQEEDQRRRGGGRMIEFDLLPAAAAASTSSSSEQLQLLRAPYSMFQQHLPPPPRPPLTTANYNNNTSLLLQQPTTFPLHHQEINWANFRPVPITTLTSAPFSSTTSTSLMPPGSYFSRPFQLHAGLGSLATARPAGTDFRVIDPPRRPHSGIWFMLQAAQHQPKQPFLPQISKSFLRIKDGGMTIRLVMKYLVNKLKLENESEVEIRCRGQQLQPFLTLQHVRDSIWSPSDVVTLLPDSSATHQIMLLHYARSA
ncbi:hypothetical protein ACH5RR_035418 [Cinchona calisaya]|uniref:Uncharacterized protein n=1 Tax=Cinchona calisaya TaxID=153742 RepID=A0ABD2Y040_9GENT